MKRNSISFKLFVITAALFTVFISTTMLLQSLFFEKFYTEHKIKTLEKNLDKFKYSYILSGLNIEFVLNSLKELQNSNNAQIAVINRDNFYNFTIISSSIYGKTDPSKNELIYAALVQWGKISKTYQPQKDGGKNIVYIIKHPVFNTNNIVVISPVVLNNEVKDVIIAVSSLQPVGEAVSAMNEFYIYIYLGAIFIIVILSLIYSNMLSKPLINLNNVASKMLELDFSTKSEINSKDEIGMLSSTLNFLSSKLDCTLKELKSANEKLKSDIDKERNIERMRKEFIAGVSHELKTPISLIEGYAEGLKDNIAEGEDRDFYIDVIIDEAKKMGQLVNDMLDLSQLDSGSYKLFIKEFDLENLIYSITRKHNNILLQKNISLNLSMLKNEIKVCADEFRIEQVITNILNNALKNTKDSGTIYIRVLDDEDKIKVEIENEGEHIKNEDMDKIWDKFYKADKSRSRDLGGTGLGLAIVKNILLLHKSSFGAVNTDIGVKFYFTLKKA